MACTSATVVMAGYRDAKIKHPHVTYLGGPGDQAHQTRVSGHNCGLLQESSRRHPRTGILYNYPDDHAHALDIGHGGNRLVAADLRNTFLLGPRSIDVRYVIDNGRVYYPSHRGGGSSSSSGHTTHIHVSFEPWASSNGSSFLKNVSPTAKEKKAMMDWAKGKASKRSTLYGSSSPLPKRRYWRNQDEDDVKRLRLLVNHSGPYPGRYGKSLRQKVVGYRKFFSMENPTSPKVDNDLWVTLYYIYIAKKFGF